MERSIALNRLRKRLGKGARYRENVNWKPADERAAAIEKIRAINARVEQLSAEMARLREELLRDPVYRALLREYKTLRAEKDQLSASARTKRFDVGFERAAGRTGGQS